MKPTRTTGSDVDDRNARSARVLGTIVATVCVMGLAGMMWLHGDRPSMQPVESLSAGAAAMPASGSSAFLHAPATDLSVPSADQVFASRPGVSETDTPAAPTF